VKRTISDAAHLAVVKRNVVGTTIRATVKRNVGGNMYRDCPPQDRVADVFAKTNMRLALSFF
jgi:hypothetical protein